MDEIFCPRCQSDGIGRPVLESRLERDDVKDNSYLKYRCDNCGCVFLIKDDHVSEGERAERNMVKSRLNRGKTPDEISKELGLSSKKVSRLIKAIQDEHK